VSKSTEEIIREFQRDRVRLIAYIRAIVGDPDLTEDIFQEVTVIVLRKTAEYDERYDLQSWCRGIARNVIKRERSKSRRLAPFEGDQIIDLVDKAFDENKDRELVDSRCSILNQCMKRLSPSNREMIGLRYVSGLSLRQLAEKLGRTELAVQVALSRLRKSLGECVERKGEGGSENEPAEPA
jgi:RNA polymerase sigma-70 factor (ECF subfamily)